MEKDKTVLRIKIMKKANHQNKVNRNNQILQKLKNNSNKIKNSKKKI